jgi:hypothetical protein
MGERAFFVHGYSKNKNELDNMRADELTALKKPAASMLAYGDEELGRALVSRTLIEVNCDGQSEAVS